MYDRANDFVRLEANSTGQPAGEGSGRSEALRKAQQIVWLVPIRFRLDIFVSILAHSHDNGNITAADPDMELPFAAFYPLDGLLLRGSPALTLVVNSADVGNTFVWVHTIRFFDA
jgi:hypothetical protein